MTHHYPVAGRAAHFCGAGRLRGFGLLEALVALTILAASGAALFSWLGQNLQTAARLKQRQAEVEQLLQAQSMVAEVNPFLQPTGERRAGPLALSWRAELISPLRVSQPTEAMESARWRVGLYRLKVQASNADGSVRNDFELLQPGLELMGIVADGARRPDAP